MIPPSLSFSYPVGLVLASGKIVLGRKNKTKQLHLVCLLLHYFPPFRAVIADEGWQNVVGYCSGFCT